MGEQLDALGGGNVRIGKLGLFVRVRPAALGGDDCMHVVGKGADGKADVLRLRDPHYPTSTPRSFSCTRVFSTDACQQDLFAHVGAPAVDWLWAGFNALILGYGQTGTGKTHSFFSQSPYVPASEQIGLLTHILSALFEKTREEGGCKVGLQCWEVRGEKTVDLLRGGTLYATGPSDVGGVLIESLGDATAVLAHCRRTSVNWKCGEGTGKGGPLPNRAHSFVGVTLHRAAENQISTLTLVDPVGLSPLSHQTPVPSQTPARTDLEKGHLDRKAARDNQRALGALTRLLSEVSQHCEEAAQGRGEENRVLTGPRTTLTNHIAPCLTNNCKTFLLATISPSAEDYLDTVSTLRVATRARAIVTPCLRGTSHSPRRLKLQSVWKVLSQPPLLAPPHLLESKILETSPSSSRGVSPSSMRERKREVTFMAGKRSGEMGRPELAWGEYRSCEKNRQGWIESGSEYGRGWAAGQSQEKIVRKCGGESPEEVRREPVRTNFECERDGDSLKEDCKETVRTASQGQGKGQTGGGFEQMASPKQVEDWELFSEMAKLDSLLSPEAGSGRRYSPEQTDGIEQADSRTVGKAARFESVLEGERLNEVRASGGGNCADRSKDCGRAGMKGGLSRDLESPQESAHSATPRAENTSRTASLSPRSERVRRRTSKPHARGAQAGPRKTSALLAMEGLDEEFRDVFSRLKGESPQQQGPVNTADGDSGDRFSGQDEESPGKQGPEAAVRRDMEGVAERDPAVEKGTGHRRKEEEAHRTIAKEGKETVDGKGLGDPSSWTSRLERVHGSIGGPFGYLRREVESPGGSPRIPKTVDGNGKRNPLSLERMNGSIGADSECGNRSTGSPLGSSRRRTPRGGLGSEPVKRKPDSVTAFLERVNGRKGAGSPTSSQTSARSQRGFAKQGGVKHGFVEMPVGLKVRSSIDKLDRKGIADLTNSLIASVAGHKRRQVDEKEISQEGAFVSGTGGLTFDTPPEQLEKENVSPQFQRSPQQGAFRTEEDKLRSKERTSAEESQRVNGEESKCIEVPTQKNGAHFESSKRGENVSSPQNPEERPEEAESGAGDYASLLELLRRERKKRAETEGKVAELENEVLECSTGYSLQVDNLRLELHKARAQCRALEKASSHAAVFEQYDRELTALRCQVRELRRENEEVRAQYETQRASATRFGGTLQQATSASVTSGSATKTEEKGGANSDSSSKDSETSPFEIARDSQLLGQSQSASQSVKLTASSSCGNESRLLEMLQRQVKQSRVDKEGLERELAATRHESRHVTIQKRAAEDAIGRGESMSRKVSRLEQEVLDLQLRERAAIGGMQHAQRAAELSKAAEDRARQECAGLGELVCELREEIHVLRRARRKEMAINRLTGKTERLTGSPTRRRPRPRLPLETLARLQRSLEPHAKRAHEIVNELTRELGVFQQEITEDRERGRRETASEELYSAPYRRSTRVPVSD